MKAFLYAASIAAMGPGAGAVAADVVTYHNSQQRLGAYVDATLTQTAAASLVPLTTFKATTSGNQYAQPLFWHPKGAANGQVIVATESNQVFALDGVTGATLWSVQLPQSVPSSDLGCGNINPEGITGTPVLDPKSGTLYLDYLTLINGAPTHEITALSLKNNGQTLAGWPLNVDAAMKAAGTNFTSYYQGQRGGALLFEGNVYFTYGGRSGDCGGYNGTVIQVDPKTQALTGNWQTRDNRGGIWAQGGLTSDGKSMFVTTGNTDNPNTWEDGEAILRLKPGLSHSTNTADYFAPANWLSLDQSDSDLGGTEAIPLDVYSGSAKPAARLVAFGKDGNGYLVNRNNLGGIGGDIAITKLSNTVIITAPAVYSTSTSTMVAFTNYSPLANCSNTAVTMINVAPKGKSPITVAWCGSFSGSGSPIVTTTDGTSNPIVWEVGATGDNELHAWNAVTGAVIFSGTNTAMQGLRRFQTLIEAEGRIYVAGDNKVYAFTWPQ
jgi:hypothetical protein